MNGRDRMIAEDLLGNKRGTERESTDHCWWVGLAV